MTASCFLSTQAFTPVLIMLGLPEYATQLTIVYLNIRVVVLAVTAGSVHVFGNRLRALLMSNLDGLSKPQADSRRAMADKIKQVQCVLSSFSTLIFSVFDFVSCHEFVVTQVSDQLRKSAFQEAFLSELLTWWPFLRTKITYVCR